MKVKLDKLNQSKIKYITYNITFFMFFILMALATYKARGDIMSRIMMII